MLDTWFPIIKRDSALVFVFATDFHQVSFQTEQRGDWPGYDKLIKGINKGQEKDLVCW
jgi:hypothetical protein